MLPGALSDAQSAGCRLWVNNSLQKAQGTVHGGSHITAEMKQSESDCDITQHGQRPLPPWHLWLGLQEMQRGQG